MHTLWPNTDSARPKALNNFWKLSQRDNIPPHMFKMTLGMGHRQTQVSNSPTMWVCSSYLTVPEKRLSFWGS